VRRNEIRLGPSPRNKRRPFPVDLSGGVVLTLTQTASLHIDYTFPSGTVAVGQVITQTAALNIDYSFPSGTLTYVIRQRYPLNIDFSFPSGALLNATNSVSVFIDGVDRTELMLVNTLQIVQQLSQASTASFGMWDPTGNAAIVPAVGQEVVIYQKSTRIFGGSVEQPVQTAFQALPGHLFSGSGSSAAASGGQTGVGSATGGGVSASGSSGGVQCTDFSALLSRRYVGQYYASPAYMEDVVASIVDIYFAQDGFTCEFPYSDPGIDMGPLLFNWVTGQAAFNTISSTVGWEFTVDYFKVIRFYPPGSGTGPAPFNIADNDGNTFAESISIEYYRSLYRNRQGIMSPTQSSYLWTDTYTGSTPGPFPNAPQPLDGIRTEFETLYPYTGLPQVLVNGVPQSVDYLSNLFVTFPQWIGPSAPGDTSQTVSQNPSGTPLTSADTLEISYQSLGPAPIYWVQDDAQIAERAAVEGNSGIYEDVEQAPSTTDPTAIVAYAYGLLQRYGANGIPFQVSYATRVPGLFVGMIQNVVLSNPAVSMIGALISAITISDVDGQFLNYAVTVISANYQGNWTQFFAALVAASSLPQPGNFVTYQWTVGPSVPGVVNPGVTGGTQPGVRVVANAVELPMQFSVYLAQPANGETQFTLLVNGTGVSALQVTFENGQEGIQTAYAVIGDTLRVYAGAQLQVFLGGPTANVMDAVCTLVTAIAVT
jgi:hypothetical protein